MKARLCPPPISFITLALLSCTARCNSSGVDALDTAFAPGPPLLDINASLAAPILLQPYGNDASTRPTYQWQATYGATSYWLFVIDHEAVIFSQGGYAAETYCSGSTCSITPDFTLSLGSARWWVLASNAEGNGPWSEGVYFTATTLAASPSGGHCHNDVLDAGEDGVDCGADCLPCRQGAFAAGIYPQGARFGLILLSADVTDPDGMAEARAAGWNTGDTYGTSWWTGDETSVDRPFLDKAASEGLLTWVGLGAQNYFAGCSGECSPYPESIMSAVIADRATATNLVWWALPEEQRWWKAGEMDVVNKYTSWTRTYDPARRPNIMYIPSHYATDGVAPYVPALDVVAASLYSQYRGEPYGWTRWRMESTVQAIRNAGASVGRDYLHGQKTPAAYLELFPYPWATNARPTTPEGSVHDFWQAIVSGARALIVLAHTYRNLPELATSWSALNDAAKRLTGPENLEEAILYGTPAASVSVEVLSGPARTAPFLTDEWDATTIDYPSADSSAVRYDGEIFVIVVSSAEDASIRIAVNGLPDVSRADVLFEDRALAMSNGRLVDDVAPLGVHVYRVIE